MHNKFWIIILEGLIFYGKTTYFFPHPYAAWLPVWTCPYFLTLESRFVPLLLLFLLPSIPLLLPLYFPLSLPLLYTFWIHQLHFSVVGDRRRKSKSNWWIHLFRKEIVNSSHYFSLLSFLSAGVVNQPQWKIPVELVQTTTCSETLIYLQFFDTSFMYHC